MHVYESARGVERERSAFSSALSLMGRQSETCPAGDCMLYLKRSE